MLPAKRSGQYYFVTPSAIQNSSISSNSLSSLSSYANYNNIDASQVTGKRIPASTVARIFRNKSSVTLKESKGTSTSWKEYSKLHGHKDEYGNKLQVTASSQLNPPKPKTTTSSSSSWFTTSRPSTSRTTYGSTSRGTGSRYGGSSYSSSYYTSAAYIGSGGCGGGGGGCGGGIESSRTTKIDWF